MGSPTLFKDLFEDLWLPKMVSFVKEHLERVWRQDQRWEGVDSDASGGNASMRCQATATSSIDGLDASIRSPGGNTHLCLPPSPCPPTASEARHPLNPVKTSPATYTGAAQDLNAGGKRHLFLPNRPGTRSSTTSSIRWVLASWESSTGWRRCRVPPSHTTSSVCLECISHA